MIRKIAVVASLGLSAFFYFSYYALYYKWRDCFNELGRCFDNDSGVIYLEQSGIIWLSLAVLTSCIALYQLYNLIR